MILAIAAKSIYIPTCMHLVFVSALCAITFQGAALEKTQIDSDTL